MRHLTVKGIKNLVIKVGASVLTRQNLFDKKIVDSISEEISALLKKGIRVSLVSSGAIAAGMVILKLKERPKAMEKLQAAAAVGQRYLMECYQEAFSRRGFSTAQVLLTWDDLAVRKRFLNAKRTLNQIQDWGLLPIVNENDTVATDEIRFGDNDKLSGLLSVLVEADLLVILSNTNGLFAGGDSKKPDRRISRVERMDPSIFSHARENKTSFTVGGMASKLSAIRMSVSSGIPVFLANGRDQQVLSRLFKGEDLGTLFTPDFNKRQSKKSWISHFMNHIEAGRG